MKVAMERIRSFIKSGFNVLLFSLSVVAYKEECSFGFKENRRTHRIPKMVPDQTCEIQTTFGWITPNAILLSFFLNHHVCIGPLLVHLFFDSYLAGASSSFLAGSGAASFFSSVVAAPCGGAAPVPNSNGVTSCLLSTSALKAANGSSSGSCACITGVFGACMVDDGWVGRLESSIDEIL
jgi:hypothetical protein